MNVTQIFPKAHNSGRKKESGNIQLFWWLDVIKNNSTLKSPVCVAPRPSVSFPMLLMLIVKRDLSATPYAFCLSFCSFFIPFFLFGLLETCVPLGWVTVKILHNFLEVI